MKNICAALLLMVSGYSFSQSYVGHSVDNYSGIHSVIYNPANIVDSPFRIDFNLVSVSAFGGSDYFSINISDVIEAESDFDFQSNSITSPTNNNNFFLNTDVVLPSVMFNLSKKSSIGLITRARGFLNVNSINGRLYDNLVNDFDEDESFSFDSSDLTTNLHAWAELGLSYGRILVAREKHFLSAGVTLKYLLGAGTAFASTPGFSGEYDATNELLRTQGFINYGSSQDFDIEDVDFNDVTGGYGLDFGFVYEWHPNREDDGVSYFQDPYKLKIGLSVTDIGSINYSDIELTNYDVNASISTANLEDDIVDILDNNYDSTSENQEATIQLPTAMHLLLDYRLGKKWLISAQANFALTNENDELHNRIINTIVLSPRLETKWFSLYAPVSFREYGDIDFGAGLRFGPLSVGSGSIISSLLTDDTQTADVFVGLKIPIYRK